MACLGLGELKTLARESNHVCLYDVLQIDAQVCPNFSSNKTITIKLYISACIVVISRLLPYIRNIRLSCRTLVLHATDVTNEFHKYFKHPSGEIR